MAAVLRVAVVTTVQLEEVVVNLSPARHHWFLEMSSHPRSVPEGRVVLVVGILEVEDHRALSRLHRWL